MTLQAVWHHRRRQRGAILIVAMLVALALTTMILALARSMRVELAASANYASARQAAMVDAAAERFVLAVLADATAGTMPDLAETEFYAVPVGAGYFWIIRPDLGDSSQPAFGLVDEASKLNLNTSDVDTLMRLPNMTTDVAAAIVDWVDGDSNLSPGGAENEAYLALREPYQAKNAPLETLEELLLVRGVTRELLYGRGPASNTSTLGSAFTDWTVEHGIHALVTVYSSEPNTASDGQQRVNINDGNRQPLRDLLTQSLGAPRAAELLARAGPAPFRDIFDLFVRTGMTQDEFGQLADRMRTSNARNLRGRVNVNTAPREVLLTLPGLESGDVDKLLAARSSTDQTVAWVAGTLQDRAVGLGNRITARSYQYSAEIVAVSGDGRAFVRSRIVVDTTSGTPVVVYRRNLTDRGFPLDQGILESLRRNESLTGQNGGRREVGL